MLEAGRTLYVVFAAHGAVEKALKACVVHRTATHPPRTHDLWALARLAQITPPDAFADTFSYLGRAFIEVRYPMDLVAAEATYPAQAVAPVLQTTEEIVAWLRSILESST